MAKLKKSGLAETFLLLATIVVVQGACEHGGKVIQVSSVQDLRSREKYPNTEFVTLILRRGLSFPSGLLLSHAYSCTVLKSADDGPVYTISSPQTSPAITVQGATNIVLSRVGISNGVATDSPSCKGLPFQDGTHRNSICPAVVIQNSADIVLAKGFVHGRVEMHQAERSSLNGMRLTSPSNDFANVNIAACGDGPSLRKSLTSVTNCEISGAPVGIWLHHGAVGVSITNNDFHDFAFSAIRCGLGQHNVGDCMLSTMSYNYIHTDPQDVKIADNTGIYFNTHWINPGNYVSCNYVEGGEHCLYLDWASSGITVDGGVCHNNRNGLKLNTGHSNSVTSLIVSNPKGLAGWISCQNYDVNNCEQDPGSVWEDQRAQFYNSPEMRHKYPWMSNLCSQRRVAGVSCNPSGSPPAQETGACSGLPTDNHVELTLVDTEANNIPTYLSCDEVPVAQMLNKLQSAAVPSDRRTFTNSPHDFGVTQESRVHAFNTNFKSCPRQRVGPQDIDLASLEASIHHAFRAWPGLN